MFAPLPPAFADGRPAGRAVIFLENHLLLRRLPDGSCRLPHASELTLEWRQYLVVGDLYGERCGAMDCDGEIALGELEKAEIRTALPALPEPERIAAGRAKELIFWRRKRQFCGSCGAPTRVSDVDSGVVCTECGAMFFPVLAPAVIVAVTRNGNELLLAHNRRFPEQFYSILAGFVEAGENAEEAIHREIREEVAIEVKNIRYFGSQCWPFPNSLMLCYTAEYESGEIKADGTENTDADWYPFHALPTTPGPGSIAHEVIKHLTGVKGNGTR